MIPGTAASVGPGGTIGSVARIPIACTLATDEMGERAAEWREFVTQNVVARARPTSNVARLRLRDGDEAALAAIDLARREKKCCAFFNFSIEPQPDATWLVIEAPDEAAALVDLLWG